MSDTTATIPCDKCQGLFSVVTAPFTRTADVKLTVCDACYDDLTEEELKECTPTRVASEGFFNALIF